MASYSATDGTVATYDGGSTNAPNVVQQFASLQSRLGGGGGGWPSPVGPINPIIEGAQGIAQILSGGLEVGVAVAGVIGSEGGLTPLSLGLAANGVVTVAQGAGHVWRAFNPQGAPITVPVPLQPAGVPVTLPVSTPTTWPGAPDNPVVLPETYPPSWPPPSGPTVSEIFYEIMNTHVLGYEGTLGELVGKGVEVYRAASAMGGVSMQNGGFVPGNANTDTPSTYITGVLAWGERLPDAGETLLEYVTAMSSIDMVWSLQSDGSVRCANAASDGIPEQYVVVTPATFDALRGGGSAGLDELAYDYHLYRTYTPSSGLPSRNMLQDMHVLFALIPVKYT